MIKPRDGGYKDPFWKILSLIDDLKSIPAPAIGEAPDIAQRDDIALDLRRRQHRDIWLPGPVVACLDGRPPSEQRNDGDRKGKQGHDKPPVENGGQQATRAECDKTQGQRGAQAVYRWERKPKRQRSPDHRPDDQQADQAISKQARQRLQRIDPSILGGLQPGTAFLNDIRCVLLAEAVCDQRNNPFVVVVITMGGGWIGELTKSKQGD